MYTTVAIVKPAILLLENPANPDVFPDNPSVFVVTACHLPCHFVHHPFATLAEQ